MQSAGSSYGREHYTTAMPAQGPWTPGPVKADNGPVEAIHNQIDALGNCVTALEARTEYLTGPLPGGPTNGGEIKTGPQGRLYDAQGKLAHWLSRLDTVVNALERL